MVLISIHPFASRKIFLLALAVLGLSTAFCFADPLFMTSQYAPPHNPVRGADSIKANVAGLEGPTLAGRSFEAVSDAREEMRVMASLLLRDAARLEGYWGLPEKAAGSAGTAACLRYGVNPNFAVGALDSIAGSF